MPAIRLICFTSKKLENHAGIFFPHLIKFVNNLFNIFLGWDRELKKQTIESKFSVWGSLNGGTLPGGRGCTLDFRFFSIVRHASTHLRKPATRGMASQHLRTFERGYLRVNKGSADVKWTAVLYRRLMSPFYIFFIFFR